MGLSASQTRYLSLTARKSNVEYQGQQINQARTALANQSSELYTQMMSLTAPTAPSVYTYVIDPATCPSIDWSDDASYPLSSSDMKNFSIYYAGNQPSFASFNLQEYAYHEEVDEETGEVINAGYCSKSYDEDGKVVYGSEYYENKDDIEGTHYIKETGYDAAGNSIEYNRMYVDEDENFTYNSSTGLFECKEGVTESELPKWIQAYNFAMGQYNTYSAPKLTNIYDHQLTAEEQEALKDTTTTNDPVPSGYKRSATNNINQAQYNAAMVQYEADLEEYEKACEVINQKTEDIHEADKKLEMQLKQLDTEQEAIQTELEAVKKVIEKNIENTFKSFA